MSKQAGYGRKTASSTVVWPQGVNWHFLRRFGVHQLHATIFGDCAVTNPIHYSSLHTILALFFIFVLSRCSNFTLSSNLQMRCLRKVRHTEASIQDIHFRLQMVLWAIAVEEDIHLPSQAGGTFSFPSQTAEGWWWLTARNNKTRISALTKTQEQPRRLRL